MWFKKISKFHANFNCTNYSFFGWKKIQRVKEKRLPSYIFHFSLFAILPNYMHQDILGVWIPAEEYFWTRNNWTGHEIKPTMEQESVLWRKIILIEKSRLKITSMTQLISWNSSWRIGEKEETQIKDFTNSNLGCKHTNTGHSPFWLA